MNEKILIIIAGLHMGGAEKVAADISRYAPEEGFEFHYLVFEGYENIYGPAIEKKGGKVISVAPPHKSYLRYFCTLLRLMREHKYKAVHSHTMFNSGLNMLAAWLSHIPVRISHSHTTKTETKVSLAQKAYECGMRWCINSLSTAYFACGVEAGYWLFGRKTFERKGYVIKNGIDTQCFVWDPANREKIRRQYGIQNAFLIGHTGTLTKVKNQEFLIEQMPGILEKRPDAFLMFVGGGESTERIRLQQLAEKYGVADKIIFTGAVHNVNEYLSAFDVFAFPSIREGTPLSLLEAQTNGLPCVVSANIPCDVFLSDLICVESLSNRNAWVNKICSARRVCPEQYCKVIAGKGYDARETYQKIYRTYLEKSQTENASVVFSFDDGRGDNTKVLDEVLLPKDMPVTLNITTGYIDGSCPEELLPTNVPPMKMEDVLRLGKNSLVEIALHGDRHENTVADILECHRKLTSWFGLEDHHAFGMASPGSGLTPERLLSEEYASVRNKLLYLRISLRNYSKIRTRILCRKIGRLVHLKLLYKIAYRDTLMRFSRNKIVHSIPVMGDTSLEQLLGIIDSAISDRANVVLMFHSVVENTAGFDQWAWSRDKFEGLCDYICKKRNEGKLTVCTTADMFRKMN